MNLKIIKDEKNVMLRRREVLAEVDFSEAKTPSRGEIAKEAAKLLNAKEELVIVSRVNTEFGKQTGTAEIMLYDDSEAIKALEGGHMIKRHEKKREGNEEATEAPAGEASEEASAEGKEE